MCECCSQLSICIEKDGQKFYECTNKRSEHYGKIVAYASKTKCSENDAKKNKKQVCLSTKCYNPL